MAISGRTHDPTSHRVPLKPPIVKQPWLREAGIPGTTALTCPAANPLLGGPRLVDAAS